MYNNNRQTPYTSEYVQQARQIQKHEIARMQQFVSDTKKHVDSLEEEVTYIGQTMKTKEENLKYSSLLLQLNKTINSFDLHSNTLNEMIQMANVDFGKTIPEQCRREIYHMYHAGRYNQTELASHYAIIVICK
jgi:hypothetical protein